MNLGNPETYSPVTKTFTGALEGLTEEQKAVVLENNGILFVAAAAGSGKTRTLIQNIAYLITEGVEPSHILAFTFTKKSADELQKRLKEMIPAHKAERVNVGTIHSTYLRILRQEYETLKHPLHPFEIIDGSRIRPARLLDEIKRALTKKGIRIVEIDNPVVLRAIGLMKAYGITPDTMEIKDEQDDERITIKILYEEYERLKNQRKLIDFDDMLLKTWQLFEEHPDIAAKWSRFYQYIFVDEFQDTNTVQSWVLKALVQAHGNMKAIGDPRQAIYAFRGGTPEIFENYQEHYPDSKLMTLSRNFRCPSNICKASNVFIEGAANPLDLDAYSENEDVGVQVLDINDSTFHEADSIVSECQRLIASEEASPRDILILYRINAQSADLESVFIEREIPYHIVGAGCFFDRREIKDMEAYLLLSQGDNISALERIYNKPNRWLGRAWLRDFQDAYDRQRDILQALDIVATGRYRRGVLELIRGINYLRTPSPSTENARNMINWVREYTGYDEWFLRDYQGDDDGSALGVINHFTNIAGRFENTEKLLAYIEMIRRNYSQNKSEADAVTLMTVHKAKGLEAPIVFVAGLADGLFPHALAVPEEEQRLFYVASTRTKSQLYLSPLLGRTGVSPYVQAFVPDWNKEEEHEKEAPVPQSI